MTLLTATDQSGAPGNASDHTFGDTTGDAQGRYQWLALALLVFGYVVYNLDKSILSVLIEPLKAEFGLHDRDLSLLSASMTIPVAICCIPLGRLADRANRKRMLALLVLGWSVMTGLSGFAGSIMFLVFARVGVGSFEAGYVPAAMSIISDEFPPRRRPSAMGLFGLGAPLGVCVGMAIGGLIAARWGWRGAFMLAAIPGILFTVLALLFLREPARGRYDSKVEEVRPSLKAALAGWWGKPVSFYAGIGMIFSAVLLSATATWTPAMLVRTYGIGLGAAGLYSALIIGIAGACGAATGGLVADRIGRNDESIKLIVPVIGLSLSVVTGLVAFLVPIGLTPMLVLLACNAFFGQSYMGPGYAAVLTHVAPNVRSTIASILLLSFGFLSYGTGTLVVGFVSDHMAPTLGSRALMAGMASTLIFSIIGMMLFVRALVAARTSRGASGPVEP